MHPLIQKIAIGVAVSAISGTAGWAYALSERVTSLETEHEALISNVELLNGKSLDGRLAVLEAQHRHMMAMLGEVQTDLRELRQIHLKEK